MFKIAYVSTIDGLKEARQIMRRIYEENPKHWPHGLSAEHFDGGVYLIREKQSNAPVGFCGWQERWEFSPLDKSAGIFETAFNLKASKVGYYSIGVLKEHRRNGFAKEALTKLIRQKAAGVDRVKALIVATNSPSLALADRLGVETQVKRAFTEYTMPWSREQPTTWDYAKPIIPLAGIGTGFKLNSDLNRILAKTDAWNQAMNRYRVMFPQMSEAGTFEVPLSQASKAIDEYTQLGRNVAQSRVLGVPAGRVMMAWDKRTNPGAYEHHRMFTDPNVPFGDVRAHMAHKALEAESAGLRKKWMDPKIFSPEMKAHMDQLLKAGPFEQAIPAFEAKFPGSPAAKLFRQAITGIPGDPGVRSIGEAVRLSGWKDLVHSTPELYAKNLMEQVHLPWRAARLPLLLGAGALGFEGLRELMQKKSAARDWDETAKDWAGAGLLAGSVPMGGLAYQRLANPNRNIGVTWGEMAAPYGIGDIGHGHAGPGKALIEMLKADPRFNEFNVSAIPRGPTGMVTTPPGRYNVLADTGLGLYAGSDPWAYGVKATHGHFMPTGIEHESHVPILTDAIPFDRPGRLGATGNLYRLPNNLFLGYGPHFEHARGQGFPNILNVNPRGLTPLIGSSTLENLRSPLPDRSALLTNLAGQFGATNPETGARLAALAANPNHKLVVISGSGRGDFVAARARDMAKALRRSGRNDVSIIAQMAAGYNDPIQHKIMSWTPEVISLPRMPGKDFVNLQRVADVHWGSSGTSSASEALSQPSVLAMPEDWGYRAISPGGNWQRRYTPGSLGELTRRHNVAFGAEPHHGMQPTQIWNRGNIQHMLEQPGVIRANRAEDIMKVLNNPELLSGLKGEAAQRATASLAGIGAGRGAINDAIYNLAMKNITRGRLRGAGLGLGALAAGGAGLHYLMRDRPQPTLWDNIRDTFLSKRFY